jgi:predicted HTH transcriptional regulator
LILQKWKPFFAWLPVETLIYEQQEGYYEALNASNTKGDSTIFVTFMLQIIRDALAEIIETQDSHHNVGVNVGTNEEKVLMLLRQDGRLTAKVLASTLGLTERQIERIMASLKKQGRLARRGASKNGYWEVIDEP